MKIKVVLEYWGGWSNTASEEYRIAKIVGAPTVQIQVSSKADAWEAGRIGKMISEKQATELATRVEVTTVPKGNK